MEADEDFTFETKGHAKSQQELTTPLFQHSEKFDDASPSSFDSMGLRRISPLKVETDKSQNRSPKINTPPLPTEPSNSTIFSFFSAKEDVRQSVYSERKEDLENRPPRESMQSIDEEDSGGYTSDFTIQTDDAFSLPENISESAPFVDDGWEDMDPTPRADKGFFEHDTTPTLEQRPLFPRDSAAEVEDVSEQEEPALDQKFSSGQFVVSSHSFDADTLESAEDSSICLSFEKDELAFVYSVDESGWGEVNLVNTLKWGWVPMNYFSSTEDDAMRFGNLQPLFRAASKLLLKPQSKPIYTSNQDVKGFTFDVGYINEIRDGVRLLLQKTNCLSRNSERVSETTSIRRFRKNLLRDWYDLMVKAQNYKNTFDTTKIDIIEILVFQVLRKSLAFVQVWLIEQPELEGNDLPETSLDYPALRGAPMTRSRVTEIHTRLVGYLAMMIGRLNLVEYNIVGCKVFEKLVHQVIMMIKELVHTGRIIQLQVDNDNSENVALLNNALDNLVPLISAMVSSVKKIISETLHSMGTTSTQQQTNGICFTDEGVQLIRIFGNMISSVSAVCNFAHALLRSIPDFPLSGKLLDFEEVIISPHKFISLCVPGLTQERKSALSESNFDEPESGYDHELYHSKIDTEIMREGALVVAASLRSLIILLTDEVNPPDHHFKCTFFLHFRSFSSSQSLLHELVTRFDVVLEGDPHGRFFSLESQAKSRRKMVCDTLRTWMESFWQPLEDHSLLAPLMNFLNEKVKVYLPIESVKLLEVGAKLINRSRTQLVQKKVSDGLAIDSDNSDEDDLRLERFSTNSTSSTYSSLKSNFLQSLPRVSSQTTLLSETQQNNVTKTNSSYRSMLGSHWHQNNYLDTCSLISSWWHICQQSWKMSDCKLTLLNYSSKEVAQQLTLIESELFCAVKVEEVMNQNFAVNKRHLNLSPNVSRSILFTNLLSSYVTESLLQEGLSTKQRLQLLMTWIKISSRCLELKNFNSLAAVITSLQGHLLSRLEMLWSALPDRYSRLFASLCKVVHPDRNYRLYRAKLRALLPDAAAGKAPVVPYFTLFLQDLTFIVEGNPNYRISPSFLGQKLINFDKYSKLTTVIANLEMLQAPFPKSDYPKRNSLKERNEYQSVFSLQELIFFELWKVKQLNEMDKDRSWNLSCALHPREPGSSY